MKEYNHLDLDIDIHWLKIHGISEKNAINFISKLLESKWGMGEDERGIDDCKGAGN